MTMKQLYKVPFERNSERVKALRYQYVQAGDVVAISIGHRATIDTPGQRGANITMCAAISENGVRTHIPHIGPYNTQLLLAFLNALYRDLIPEQERGLVRPHLPNYVVVWDNVSFHRTNSVRDWFAAHERITVEFLPPYSPFLNPIEVFFSMEVESV
ncbi:hypothetical protein M9458_051639 [Cirrhinus mrigala]|uniref:Tc1-like transposase DDE domain-containing protein n=1 Tax=Cirrhinus mrigala TaxID=683832 RepID=A0ABD0MTX9_CIRMR